MNSADAARLLNVTRRTVQRWVAEGVLSSHREGRLLVLDPKEVQGLAKQDSAFVKSLPVATVQAITDAYSKDGGNWKVADIKAHFKLTDAEWTHIRGELNLRRDAPPVSADIIQLVGVDGAVQVALDRQQAALREGYQTQSRAQLEKMAANWAQKEDQTRALVRAEVQFAYEAGQLPRPRTKDKGPITSNETQDHLVVIFPTDWHYGKYGTSLLGKGAYDRTTALRRLHSYVSQTLRQVEALAPGATILVIVGSDGSNVDNVDNRTSRGTPQDQDGHPLEGAMGTYRAYVDLIDQVRAAGHRVIVRIEPGNHDRMHSYMTLVGLESAYRNYDDVEVVLKAETFAFGTWGHCGFLFHHGDGRSAPRDLAEAWMTQEPMNYALSKAGRYAFLGHRHHTMVLDGAGITVLQHPSMSGSDAYHALKWPGLHRPKLWSNIFHKTRGRVGSLVVGAHWDEQASDWV